MRAVLLVVALAALCSAETCNVMSYGATGNGKTDDSQAFGLAIAACSAAGGGTVLVPNGAFLIGSIELPSHTQLFISPKAWLLGLQDMTSWPTIPAMPSYPITSGKNSSPRLRPWIYIGNAYNVSITGSGVLDAQGSYWWNRDLGNFSRPFMVETYNSSLIRIVGPGLRFSNSPFWTIHIYASDDVVITNITVSNPVDSPNTDGMDIDSSSNVVVRNVYIQTGDDNIAIKSGEGEEGRAFNRPSENVLIVSCNFPHGSGVALGSEGAGGFHGIVVTSNHFGETANIVRLKGCSQSGGVYQNVSYIGNKGDLVDTGIFVDLGYECNPPGAYPPLLDNVQLFDVQNVAGVHAGQITCDPVVPCSFNMTHVILHSVDGFACSGNVSLTWTDVDPEPTECT